MNKALNHYLNTIPKNRTKEELTYAYGDGRYQYCNGFSVIITTEEPDYTPMGVRDRAPSLNKLDYPVGIPTLAELNAEIKRRGITKSQKLTDKRLYKIADWAKFDIFYIRDIVSVLGYCHGYWDREIVTCKDGKKVAINGLRFVSDKGEALLLPVSTKTP